MQQNLEICLASAREQGRVVPRFVERELRAYLACGILADTRKLRLLPLAPCASWRDVVLRDRDYRQLIEQVRRELALHHLKDPSVDLTDIAFSVGYSELSAFDRAFRRWTGISPGEHRRRELGRQLGRGES